MSANMDRRSWVGSVLGAGALYGLDAGFTAQPTDAAQVGPKDNIKVTKIETFVLTNSWVFVKISTDAGITGWGEMLKDDAKACAAGALEVGDYLIGQDPQPRRFITGRRSIAARSIAAARSRPRSRAASTWRCGTSRARCYGVPVYKLLGGPTRDRIRVYGRPNPDERRQRDEGAAARHRAGARSSTTKARRWWTSCVERFKALREKIRPGRRYRRRVPRRRPAADGDAADEGARAVQSLVLRGDRPGRSTSTSWRSWRSKTHIPIATGERIFTKWGFKDILEKRAATILQPDVCYAGGITELKIIAGMAEAYYTPLAPHNPQGPCSLAASLQIAASIPNFLIQERGDNEYTDLLAKPLPPIKNGHRPLLTEPGLGITIDENKLMAQVGEPRPYLPRFDPDDGSVVDW